MKGDYPHPNACLACGHANHTGLRRWFWWSRRICKCFQYED